MEGNYIFVNPAFCNMSGYTEKELLGMTVFDMKAKDQNHNSFEKTKKSPQIIRVTLKRKDGSQYFTEIIGDVITVQNKSLVLGTIRDITDQVNAENEVKKINENLELLVKERTNELKKTVGELNKEIVQREAAETKILVELGVKEILLKEITHRVKNNLQIIASLIRLQLRSINNPEASDLLNQTSNRIQSISLIHDTLNNSHNIKELSFEAYIVSLVKYIKTTFTENSIDIKVTIDDFVLPLDDATNFGMILMELITNSIKHAFPNKENATIEISMRDIAPQKYELTVKDNGVGFPDGIDFKSTESLGMQVVNSLAEQLNASVELINRNGTTFKITHLLDSDLHS